MSEKPRYEMRLNEKLQFEYAKFCQFIDEMPDSWFDQEYFNKKQIKEWLFDVLNDDPTRDLAWSLDWIFNKIIQNSKNISMEKLGALRLELSQAVSNNFKTEEFIFPAPFTTDTTKDIKMKDVTDLKADNDSDILHLDTNQYTNEKPKKLATTTKKPTRYWRHR